MDFRMRQICALAAIFALTACVAQQPDTPLGSSPDPAAMSIIRQAGGASITGQAFARQRGGGVVTAAGEEILLVPATPYTREVVRKMGSGQKQAQAASIMRQYTRSTIADAGGNFRFAGLAAGSYIVLAQVQWEVPTQYGSVPQGGGMWQEVGVSAGEQASIIMSR